jgi:hypothetical protein
MSALVSPPNVVAAHVGVDLGSGDVGVSEHGLNTAKIRAAGK